MYRIRNWLLLPVLLILGSLCMLLRYILRTPQPLASLLPGSDHLYKWTHGQVFYKVYGKSDAPPLLLLHAPGIGASAHEMLPMMESLAPHYHIYAPDLPGFGLSDTPDIDYTADVFVAFCHDFLRNIVQQPATLLARGLSCAYALTVAARSPELCTQLVLLSPHYPQGYLRGSFNGTSHYYSRLSRMLARSPLLRIFFYALLTPRSILQQIIRLQHGGIPISQDDLTYAFAAAHQLGAQYAALAFVTGKLSLDVTLETPTQPTLLLWNTPPSINAVTQHYMNIPQVQAISLYNGRHYKHASTTRNVTAALLAWQETQQKKRSLAASAKTARSENVTPATPYSLPTEPSPETVENSQPPDLNTQPTGTNTTVEAYCMKCKQKRIMLNAQKIVTRNGRSAMEGRCPVCNTRLFRFVSG